MNKITHNVSNTRNVFWTVCEPKGKCLHACMRFPACVCVWASGDSFMFMCSYSTWRMCVMCASKGPPLRKHGPSYCMQCSGRLRKIIWFMSVCVSPRGSTVCVVIIADSKHLPRRIARETNVFIKTFTVSRPPSGGGWDLPASDDDSVASTFKYRRRQDLMRCRKQEFISLVFYGQ